MPKITATNESVHELKGLHLYHAGWSNCSMRVRMTLEEKRLPWTSHHLDTRRGEHITPEYFGINPNGLVPALVHDGDVWIESADIIRYLDDIYPEPRLMPADEERAALVEEWRKLASEIHVKAVKTYIYASRPSGSRRRKTAEDMAYYRSLQTNEELLAFHEKDSSDEGITESDRAEAERLLHEAFARLDAVLGEQAWLAGNEFTLADITWLPLYYTLAKVGFPFDSHANVLAWAKMASDRPSYQKGIVDWFDGPPEVAEAG